MPSELLQQVRVLDPVTDTDRIADVLITDGSIAAVADRLGDYPADTELRDCAGYILGPGLVDLYSHSGEPGYEERETLESLMQAAIAGGFTRLGILPDTHPAIDDVAHLQWLYHAWQTCPAPKPHLHPWAALTQGTQGQRMTELGELAQEASLGFSDGTPVSHLGLVRRILEYLQEAEKTVAFWACDPELVGDGVMREGQESIQFGLPGIPEMAEGAALSALLECVAAFKTPVHLMRISTARGVQLVQQAKERGLPITASTTWLHLLLNSQAIAHYDPNLRLDPPLGNAMDQQALQEGLRRGIIDAIAIDHHAYTYEEKTVAFSEAPPGAIGLELALPLLWHGLAATTPALTLWRCLSTNPALCIKQNPATIAAGNPTEMILFDPQAVWIVEPSALKSLACNTSWLGQTIRGKVLQVWTAA